MLTILHQHYHNHGVDQASPTNCNPRYISTCSYDVVRPCPVMIIEKMFKFQAIKPMFIVLRVAVPSTLKRNSIPPVNSGLFRKNNTSAYSCTHGCEKPRLIESEILTCQPHTFSLIPLWCYACSSLLVCLSNWLETFI